VVRQLAREQQLELVDLYEYFAELAQEGVDTNTLFTDAMHPNPAGQQRIAELLEPKLRGLLPAK
jgi:lysophospholipase L1-like esterase